MSPLSPSMLFLDCDARVTSHDDACDFIQYRLCLLQYLVVPEAQDEKSLRFDQAITLLVVVGILLMLPAIELYDDLCL